MSTIVNQIVQEEVSMALQHMLVAPFGTASPTPSQLPINVSSPPAGYIHLGAVVDDSPVVQLNKQKYQLQTGLPRIVAYEVMISIAGEMGATLIGNSNFKAFMGGGGASPNHVLIAAHSTALPAVTSTTVARNLVTVSTNTGFTAGAMVVTDTSAALLTTYNFAFIVAVNSGSIQLSTDGFPFIPVTGQPIAQVLVDQYPLGTKRIPYFHVLGVADFLNNGQVIHDFPRATPRGQWQEALRVGTEERIPTTWDMQGFVDSLSGENIIGYRYYYAGNTIQ